MKKNQHYFVNFSFFSQYLQQLKYSHEKYCKILILQIKYGFKLFILRLSVTYSTDIRSVTFELYRLFFSLSHYKFFKVMFTHHHQ